MVRGFTIALAAVFVSACNPQPEHAPRASAAPTQAPTGVPPLRITGRSSARAPVRIVEQNASRRLYTLIARSYVSRSSGSAAQATFQDADVTFFAQDGTTLRALSPAAAVDERRRTVVMTGGVHATSSNGSTLTCDTLTYDRDTGLIYGDGNVRMTGRQGTTQQVLTGNSFTSNVTLTEMKMQ
ncbi:MAG: LPS export ABC transporter periplasmic protein LptC [Candidatus Eremiobacteraeota bacterium]|nr:LPS export ABC transporter periplasmic protein LptC [Candidatus Eremiobacteraeota bacterium]